MPGAVLALPLSPTRGCVVHCRSHRWLVEEVEAAEHPEGDTVVRLACLDDAANGQKLWQCRQETQLQPVVFRDPQEVNADRVHLHLEHPLVTRLHDEVLAVAAGWDPSDPSRRLRRLSIEKSGRALNELEASLQQRLEALERITPELQRHLSAEVAKRADDEAARFVRVLEEQRLQTIDSDLAIEPERIRRTFALQTHRVEPAGRFTSGRSTYAVQM